MGNCAVRGGAKDEQLDEDQAKVTAGADWDQAVFADLAVSNALTAHEDTRLSSSCSPKVMGKVSKKQFLKALAKSAKNPKAKPGSGRAADGRRKGSQAETFDSLRRFSQQEGIEDAEAAATAKRIADRKGSKGSTLDSLRKFSAGGSPVQPVAAAS